MPATCHNKEHSKPLSAARQRQVIDETHAYIAKAAQLFAIRQAKLDIMFDLTGRAAGMYRVRKRCLHQRRQIRYNPYIFARYFDDNLATTVPHEVAHYVSDMIYGLNNIKPHGREWKQIMAAFDADDSVTASYDLSGIPRRTVRTFTYHCGCGEQQLSAIRHNKVLKRQYQYYCKVCRQTLQFKAGTE